MNFIKVVKYSIVILVMSLANLYSQAPSGAFTTYEIQENLDTVKVHRQLSPWWFGVTGGATLGMSFNSLKIPDIIPENGDVIPTKIIDFNTGYGSGYFLGLYGEYLPIDEMWGVTLRINFLDYRNTESESDEMPDNYAIDSICTYKNTNKFNYLNIAPSVRYNLTIPNLFLFVGADLEFNLSHEILKRKKYKNSADINHDKIVKMDPNGFRAAVHFGVGYDIFAADINNAVRAYIAPFASVHIGTKEISAYESSRIPFMLKMGANVKFNIDEKHFDTIPVNREHLEAPQYIASYRKETGVNFPGVTKLQPGISGMLREVPEEEIIDAELTGKSEKEEIKAEQTERVTKSADEPKKRNITINPGATKIFYYPTSESSTITKVNKEYLDALAEYLQKNPRATLRITGHSDNAGSTVQNQERSEKRATAVVQYMMKKGIARRRLLDRGRGALEPVADNTTATGRSKNRRVEIQIVR